MEYLLKSTVILTLFYVIYKLFLQNETFFKSIRGYFLTGIISALIVPLITITKYIQVNPINIPSEVIYSETSTSIHEQPFDWMQLLIVIYLMGVVAFTLRFLAQLSSLAWFLYTHSKSKKENYILVKTTKNIAPFSFFNYIAYNNDQFNNNELDQILTHEKVHVNQYHSIDILLSQFIVIVNWYNPLVWLYKKEVQKNLEYIADEFAQKVSQKEKEYQYLLLKTTSLDYKMALTTNFYNSLIKKRIDMLQKNRSNKTMYLKFTLIIPILIAFIFTFNTKIIAQTLKTKESQEVSNVKEIVEAQEVNKKTELIEIEQNQKEIIITKDNSKFDLNKFKTYFSNKGITLKLRGIKRNNKGEITAIKIYARSKTSKINFSSNSGKPIQPIKISFDNGNILIGSFNNTNSNTRNYHNNINVIKYANNDSIKINDTYLSNKKTFITRKASTEEEPLFIVNGKVILYENLKDIDPDGIKSIIVLKDNKAIALYGSKGKNGVIEITTKNNGKIKVINNGKDLLYLVDGKEVSKEELENLNPEIIEGVIILKGNNEDEPILVRSLKITDRNVIRKENISKNKNEFSVEAILPTDAQLLKDQKSLEKYDNKEKNGVIEITTKKHANNIEKKKPIHFINGQKSTREELDNLNPDVIEKINVLKGEKAIEKYGKKGRNGVIEVITKK